MPTAAAPRRAAGAHALPRHGCDLHPSCLSCPLVRCRYDEPGGARRLLSDERDQPDRASCSAAGERRSRRSRASFGVSRRTVFRVAGASAGAQPEGRLLDDDGQIADRQPARSSSSWCGCDSERLRAYRDNLAFYRGQQWAGSAATSRAAARLQLRQALIDKTASYLMSGVQLRRR